MFATSIAEAMLKAQENLQDGSIGIGGWLNMWSNHSDNGMCLGIAQLTGVTRNRRANISPYLNEDDIDPNLGVIGVNDANGKPIATGCAELILSHNIVELLFMLVWNYAIHGTCWGPSQLLSNGDIMGGVNSVLETMNSGVAMFINGDAGDISPSELTSFLGPVVDFTTRPYGHSL